MSVMSAGGPKGQASTQEDSTLKTAGIHISTGSSITAADTGSSVRLPLDFPRLFQLTNLLTCVSDFLLKN